MDFQICRVYYMSKVEEDKELTVCRLPENLTVFTRKASGDSSHLAVDDF